MRACPYCAESIQPAAIKCRYCGERITPIHGGPNASGKRISIGLILLIGCAAVVPVAGILAAIAIPNFMEMQYRAKRAEVPANIDGIKLAQTAYNAAFGEYVACGSRAEAEEALYDRNGKGQIAWDGTCWDTLGWSPDGMVRGHYWVEVSADGTDFTIWGISDVDGDKEFATYSATSTQNTYFHNQNYVY